MWVCVPVCVRVCVCACALRHTAIEPLTTTLVALPKKQYTSQVPWCHTCRMVHRAVGDDIQVTPKYRNQLTLQIL